MNEKIKFTMLRLARSQNYYRQTCKTYPTVVNSDKFSNNPWVIRYSSISRGKCVSLVSIVFESVRTISKDYISLRFGQFMTRKTYRSISLKINGERKYQQFIEISSDLVNDVARQMPIWAKNLSKKRDIRPSHIVKLLRQTGFDIRGGKLNRCATRVKLKHPPITMILGPSITIVADHDDHNDDYASDNHDDSAYNSDNDIDD